MKLVSWGVSESLDNSHAFQGITSIATHRLALNGSLADTLLAEQQHGTAR